MIFDLLSSFVGQLLPPNTGDIAPQQANHPDNTLFGFDLDKGASWQAAAGQPRDWVPWEATEQDLGGFGNAARVAALQAPGVLGDTPPTPVGVPAVPNDAAHNTPPGVGTPDPRDTGANYNTPQQGAQEPASTVRPTPEQETTYRGVYQSNVEGNLRAAQAPRLSTAYVEGAPPGIGPDKLEEPPLPEQGPPQLKAPPITARPMKLGHPPSKTVIKNGDLSVAGMNIEHVYSKTAPYMGRVRSLGSIDRIILHGTRDKPIENLVKYGQRVDKARGFDPGYHFYVGRDGRVIQGAPLDRITYGARRNNTHTVHISFIGGDGEHGLPNKAQTRAGLHLASVLGRTLNLDNKRIWGHGEIQGDRHHLEAGTIAETLRKKGWLE